MTCGCRKTPFVTWIENEEPWDLENKLLNSLSIPLNIQGNKHHPYASLLAQIRSLAIVQAEAADVVDDNDPRL